jgi:hypothetical protein
LLSLAQRKLESPEYKNVEEDHRVAMIKVETTLIAAEDLKKYGNALDKVSRGELVVSYWLSETKQSKVD